VLSTYEQQVVEFNKETCLIQAQIRGEDAIPTLEGTYRATRPLTMYEQQLLDFAKSSGLTPAQLLGDEEITPHKGANRPDYVPGREHVLPRLLQYLPTRMYVLHKWHIFQVAGGMELLYVLIEDNHYFRGQHVFIFPCKNSGSYSIWMQLASHSSVARLCKCLFYYKLKINALATVSHI
jgi:hypothetical protein